MKFLCLMLFFSLAGLVGAHAQNNKQLYKQYRTEGEQLLTSGNLNGARAAFENALKNKEGDEYAAGKIAEIANLIQSKFKVSITEADQLFAEGKLDAAKSKYEEALAIIPDDRYAQSQIDACLVTPGSSFFRIYGGKSYDEAHKVLKLEDGSYLVAGRSAPESSNTDMYLIKTDRDGNMAWSYTFGDEETEEAADIIATKDGGYILVGHSDSFSGSPGMKDMWAVKVDKNGKEVWNKLYGQDITIDEATAIEYAHDGGYIILGHSFINGSLDIMCVKIDESGEKIWEKFYGGTNSEEGADIIKTEKGYAILGNTESKGKGKWDIWLLEIDQEGKQQWDMTYGGGDNDVANSFLRTDDGGYLIAGSTYSFAFASQDMWLLKADKGGSLKWQKAFGGLAAEEAVGITRTKDGNYVAVGSKEVWDEKRDAVGAEEYDIYLVKISEDGQKVWERNFGGIGEQRGFDLTETADGNLLVVGMTRTEETNGTDVLIVQASNLGMAHIK